MLDKLQNKIPEFAVLYCEVGKQQVNRYVERVRNDLKEINSERESYVCCDGSCFRKVVGQGLCQDNLSAAI